MIFLQLEVWKIPFESEICDFRRLFASKLYFPTLHVLLFEQLLAEIEEQRNKGMKNVPDFLFITCYLELSTPDLGKCTAVQ